MNASPTHRKFVLAVGTAVVGVAVPALPLLSAGTAQAVPDVAEHGVIAIIDNLPAPRTCGGCQMFDPQPDPPGFADPGSRVGLGGPDTLPPMHGFNPQPDPPRTPTVDLGPKT